MWDEERCFWKRRLCARKGRPCEIAWEIVQVRINSFYSICVYEPSCLPGGRIPVNIHNRWEWPKGDCVPHLVNSAVKTIWGEDHKYEIDGFRCSSELYYSWRTENKMKPLSQSTTILISSEKLHSNFYFSRVLPPQLYNVKSTRMCSSHWLWCVYHLISLWVHECVPSSGTFISVCLGGKNNLTLSKP